MTTQPYRVLARKYRPHTFDDLIGQDVLVQTLSNAFASNRIAHAFLLTGIRGIGKTTTARIIARGLNCIGEDGNGGPTTSPCGVCANCKMILEERHVDVIEMDAASRTGVDDIRDLIDTVHYAPTSARYKVYIIDEVHMLSKNAFNALLKTLEEPPEHVKFIFATTELRKIPITIVSRCQRFDLKRIDTAGLTQHLTHIAQKEAVTLDTESAQLIATVAEGSVRDSLSMLDQAISMGADSAGNISITPEAVRDMLGMADKTQSFSLLEDLYAGKPKEVVERLHSLYRSGIDPIALLGDLLSLTHYITRIKLAPSLGQDVHYADIEQSKAQALANALDMPALTRSWQMLLKGIGEAKIAPDALAATEMILVRIAYSADLPSPADIIKTLKDGTQSPTLSTPATTSHNSGTASGNTLPICAPTAENVTDGNTALAIVPTVSNATPVSIPQPQTPPVKEIESFEHAVAMFEQQKEAILYSHLYHDVRLVSFEQGRIVLRPLRHLPADIPARLSRHLSDWTGTRWIVNFNEDEKGELTLHEQQVQANYQKLEMAKSHPLVKEALALFDGAEVVEIIDRD